MKSYVLTNCLIVSFFTITQLGCGSSIFESAEKEDVAADAAVLLEEGKGQEAADLLQAEIENDPTNYTLVSLLASAQAMIIGVDEIRVALKLANPDSSESTTGTSSSSNEVSLLFDAVPAGTSENIQGLDTALTTLQSIPAESRTSGDQFKLTLYFTARLSLVTKSFDTDGDGQVSPIEMLDLDATDATSILATLDNAEAAIASAGDDEGSAAAAAAIAGIKSDIANQEGSTDEERLQNYLGSSE